jgi:uncharacterized protein
MTKAKTMNDSEWEGVCTRCGLCCFEKIENEKGAIFFTRTPCRYLDIITRECRIYENRFTINTECVKLTPALLREIRWLHDDCGYRKALVRDAEQTGTDNRTSSMPRSSRK